MISQNDTKKIVHVCNICENEFNLESQHLEIGDIIECPVCGSTLEIINIDNKGNITTSPVVRGK